MPTKHYLSGLIILLLCLGLPAAALAFQPFPDTGQTKCYDNSSEIPCPQPGQPFYGQDPQYQPRLPRSYTKLGMNGAELADDAAHVDDGGQWIMTRDNVTGLIWEIKTEANKEDEYTWQNAQDVFIAGLNSNRFGGFSDWRLPDAKELSLLVNSDVYRPTIDVEWFPKTVSSAYWSATSYASNTSNAVYVGFSSGHVNRYSKSDSYSFSDNDFEKAGGRRSYWSISPTDNALKIIIWKTILRARCACGTVLVI